MIHSSLRVPDSLQTTGGKSRGVENQGGGGSVGGRYTVLLRYQVLCICPGADREPHGRVSPRMFPDPEECCITPSTCSLPARPRTEAPLREAAADVGCSPPSEITLISAKS